MQSTPVIRQLNNQSVNFGAVRGKKTTEGAKIAFEEINKIVSHNNKQRDGSDKPFNKVIAAALRDILQSPNILSEKTHPWLDSIIPDIIVEDSSKLICLEFCYTKNNRPSAIADYVLNKLDNYMRQIEGKFPELFKH